MRKRSSAVAINVRSRPPLALTRLVACDEDDSLPDCVEREGRAPCAARGVKAQRLHVRVLRVLERVNMRTAELGPEMFEQPSFGEQGGLPASGGRAANSAANASSKSTTQLIEFNEIINGYVLQDIFCDFAVFLRPTRSTSLASGFFGLALLLGAVSC